MAFRLFATKLITALMIVSLAGCLADPGGQKAFAWQPETTAEKQLRQKAEALQSTVGEGASAGFVLGALIGGLTGGMQGAFQGARLGRFIGSASGAYVRGLQSDYATREAQLNQLSADLAVNNADLASAISVMRTVLAEQRGQLAAARATGNKVAVTRAREQAAGNLAVMNQAVEAATHRQSVLGEARSLMIVTGPQTPQATPLNARYELLANRISAMRSIAATLVSEI